MQEKKYFTVEEVNEYIPELTGQVRALIQLKNMLGNLRAELDAFFEAIPSNGGDKNAFSHLQVGVELKRILDRIEASGCLIKGLDPPLVDFPHMRDGREVYLCWRYGEKEIEYWHEIDSGYDGRQPLEKL